MDRNADVVVLGGGLAGLSAALLLARSGRSVAVLEKGAALGGRARTRDKSGFLFNVGAHALYRGGAGHALLKELGVPFTGRPPEVRTAFGVNDAALHALPTGLASLARSGLLGLRGKWEFARLLARLPGLDPSGLDGVPLSRWIVDHVRGDDVAELLRTFFRVATYSDDPDLVSARAALSQLQLAFKPGVLYLDGGWQTLVDGLAERARTAGVRIETGSEAEAIEHDGTVRGVRTRSGHVWTAPAVLSTVPAAALAALPGLEGTAIAERARASVPVRAATLDLALHRLPRPDAIVAFGVGRPLYFSVHSAAARLAPEGAALVHVMSYRSAVRESDDRAVERELEALADRVQPGWRDQLVERRFVPDLLVSSALPLAGEGGLAGRPGVAVPERPGLFVAGDWVGSEGLLADASLASARAEAEAIVTRPARAAAA